MKIGKFHLDKKKDGLGNVYVGISDDSGQKDDWKCDDYADSIWDLLAKNTINDSQYIHRDDCCYSILGITFKKKKVN